MIVLHIEWLPSKATVAQRYRFMHYNRTGFLAIRPQSEKWENRIDKSII